jgi:hypothetical protein
LCFPYSSVISFPFLASGFSHLSSPVVLSSTDEYGKHNRTGNGENINRSTILSRRGTIAKRRNQRWGQIEAIMWENEEEENRTQGRGK